MQAQSIRVQDLDKETNKVRSPIFGLRELPLPALDEAIAFVVRAGLVSAHDGAALQFSAYDFADQRLREGPDPYGLTRDEIGSIHLYTQDSPWYRVLNEKLRDAHRQALKPFFAYLKLFFTGIYKLPVESGTFFRGIKRGLADLGIYTASAGVIIWWGVSSCTRRVGVLNDHSFLGSSGKRSLFAIELKRAVSITAYSALGDAEEEIIALPGLCMRVQGEPLKLDEDGGNMVQLQEADDVPSLIDFLPPEQILPAAPPQQKVGRDVFEQLLVEVLAESAVRTKLHQYKMMDRSVIHLPARVWSKTMQGAANQYVQGGLSAATQNLKYSLDKFVPRNPDFQAEDVLFFMDCNTAFYDCFLIMTKTHVASKTFNTPIQIGALAEFRGWNGTDLTFGDGDNVSVPNPPWLMTIIPGRFAQRLNNLGTTGGL